MSYNSKYKSSEIEEILDSVEDKQNKITDLDTIRSGAAKGATALQSVPSGYATTSDLDNKVDKVSGKQLSTEDFTTALKTKLEGLSNYDDTELSDALSTLRGDFDKLVSGDTTTAIKTFNEVIAFLDGLKDTQDLASIIASIEQQIAGKMDKVTLATVATSGSYNDLSNKPTIPSAVTESTVSGWGFTKNTGTYSKPSTGIPKSDLASAVQTSLGKADTALQSVPNTYATNAYVDNKLATAMNFYRTRFTFVELVEAKYNGGLIQEGGKAELAQAITLGKTIVMDYDSVSGAEGHILCNATLEGNEILLQVVFGNEHIVISTFTDGDTIYPDDITCDTFVAESDFNGTIEGLNANKQDTLVSGTNIKTINGQSLLGSGNITISGGSGGGEDIRYFTEFTVEQILATTTNMLETENSELLGAVQNNKLICIPYQDGVNGFIVASYKEEESCMYFLDERVLYKLDIVPFSIFINRIYLSHNTVYSNNTDTWVEEVYDNSTYIESNPATNTLRIQISEDLLIGSTIRFTTGEDCSLQIGGRGANNLLWANGVIPTIEPGVTYELSLRTDYTDTRRAYAVLTPFKSV